MSKRVALFLAIAFAAVGCTTTGPKDYQADHPPPLAEGPPRPKPTETGMLPVGKSQVSAESIDESNYHESVRRLETEMRNDRAAMSKLGR